MRAGDPRDGSVEQNSMKNIKIMVIPCPDAESLCKKTVCEQEIQRRSAG